MTNLPRHLADLTRTRVFVSFDFDNDFFCAKALGQQLADERSPFYVENWSMKEAKPLKLWRDDARMRINRSDVLLVVLGPSTYRAPGVLDEVAMAIELGVPRRQVVAYRGSNPMAVPNGGPVYGWDWPSLRAALDVPRRRAA